MQKLLVTTALEETWGNAEPIVFLGEWCKLYERRHVWSERTHETIPFHWDDRDKLARDYAVLESLHHRLLDHLSTALNQLHDVNYSKRYWQILLDPWLLTYIATLFDRWENARVAFEQFDQLKAIFARKSGLQGIPFSYTEFLNQSFSDVWNQILFERIIQAVYQDQCEVQAFDKQNVSVAPQPLLLPKDDIASGLMSKLDGLLSHMTSRHDMMFFLSKFSLGALIRLNLKLKQVPRLFLKEFQYSRSVVDFLSKIKVDASKRKGLMLAFKPQSEFERFIQQVLPEDFLICLVEGYAPLHETAQKVSIQTKAIVTAMAHWRHVPAKFWFAEQVSRGSKLIVLEHGGSFPAPKELFDFDEDISDIKGTWFEPYHAKHIQIVPSKLAGGLPVKKTKSNKKERLLIVIGQESPRWAYRCHFYPISAQCLNSFTLSLQLYAELTPNIQSYFRAKPYPNQGWNTYARYEEALGKQHVLSEPVLAKVFNEAKLLVCTYPETTFSEAMSTGIPTILLYPKTLYERHVQCEPLLNQLRDADIIFHDSRLAAMHLNKHWDEPEVWWDSTKVQRARAAFSEQALKAHVHWLKDWKQITERILGK